VAEWRRLAENRNLNTENFALRPGLTPQRLSVWPRRSFINTMPALTTSTLLDTLRFRYATKQFDASRKIDSDTWAALEASLVLTPSSFGLQPWKFIVVSDPELRAKILPNAWDQTQVTDCSHLVVMAVRKTVNEAYIDQFIARIAEVRGIPAESLAGYRGMMTGSIGMMTPDWAAKQAYIALGQFMLAAATLGVDTCPMEGFVPAKVDEILGLPERGLTAAVLCPAGYRAAEDKYAALPKVRWSESDVIEHR
jgi:nitroreductase